MGRFIWGGFKLYGELNMGNLETSESSYISI